MMWDGKYFRCDCGGLLELEDTMDESMDFQDGSGHQYNAYECLSCKKKIVADVNYKIVGIEISEA